MATEFLGSNPSKTRLGIVAQLGERLPCTQDVAGSSPVSSTIIRM